MSEKICPQPSMNGEPFHIVQRGENLFSIARRYTGDLGRWPELGLKAVGRPGARMFLPDSWNIGKLHSGTSEGEKVLGRLIRYTDIDPFPVLLTSGGERVLVDLLSLRLLEPQVKDLNELVPVPVVKSRKTCERCGHETPKQYCGDCLGDMSRALTGAPK